jgi:hypothetical protein
MLPPGPLPVAAAALDHSGTINEKESALQNAMRAPDMAPDGLVGGVAGLK